MKILCLRFSSIGDIVLCTSLINFLKFKFGEKVEIDFLTSFGYESILEGHPNINNIYSIDRKSNFSQLYKSTQKLQRQDYDMIIDFHGSLRSLMIKIFLWDIPAVTFSKHKLKRFLFVRFKKKSMSSLAPVSERYVDQFCHKLGISYNRQDFVKYNQGMTDLKVSQTSLPTSYHREGSPRSCPYIVFYPAASSPTKKWSIEYFNQLIRIFLEDPNYINFEIIIIAGKNDNECTHIDKHDRVTNLQGKLSLSKTAIWLKHAVVCVGNDTGLAHMAEAQGTPVVTLFGPTHPDLGFAPLLKQSKALVVPALTCQPCSHTGSKACYLKEQLCFSRLKPKEVFDQMVDLL